MIFWWRMIVAAVLAVLLCLPGVVRAGGWLVMTLDELPSAAIPTGQEVTIGLVVRQHGQTPIDGVEATATFVQRESGRRIDVPASREGGVGHYVVRFTPPAAGAWDWSIFAWEMRNPMPPLNVVPASPPTATATALPTGRSPWLLLAAAGLALAGVGGLVAAWRDRRATARRLQYAQ